MSDKTIKHFIFTRFFTYQSPNYPYDIFDTDFIQKQLTLANNILRSLENQTNKNFELVFVLNDKYFDNPKYEFIFSTLKDSTTLTLSFTTAKVDDIYRLIKDACEKYDFVIQTRMDFDDFIYKDAVADTQNKVDECENILLYGYCKGYLYVSGGSNLLNKYIGDEYADGVINRIFYPSKGVGHLGIFQSIILKSSFAPKLSPFTLDFFPHHRAKTKIQRFIEKNGIEFSENMFQQNLDTNAFIYFRHDFSHFILATKGTSDTWIIDQGKLPSTSLLKKELEKEFGFHFPLKSIKDEADFNYNFKSTAEEFGSRQDLTVIKWIE